MQTINWLNDLYISELKYVNTYIYHQKNYPFSNRSRHYHGFLYTLVGTETYHFRERNIEAVPHSVLYIPKGEVYKVTLSGEESVMIAMEFETATPPLRPFCIKFPENNTVKTCFQDAQKIWDRKKADYLPTAKSLFYKLTGILLKQKSLYLNSDKFDKIEASVNYLHNHYLESDFRIQFLSDLAGISQKYFETLFYQRYGVMPKEYVLMLRLERAKELLSGEKNTISDIAFQLGYTDIYHFSKLFKAKTGVTPSEYRRAHSAAK